MAQAHDTRELQTLAPRRGRKPLGGGDGGEARQQVTREATAAAEAAAPAVRELRESALPMLKAELEESLRLAATTGAIAAFRLNAETNRVAMLKAFAEIRESKAYRGCVVRRADTGELVAVHTWEEFCEAHGYSYQKIAEDLKNLSVFGGNVLEQQKRLGLGYRDLRALRRGIASMGPEEQAALREELEAAEGNEALESAVDRLQNQVRDLKADLKARDTVLEKKSDELITLQTEMEKRAATEEAAGQELLDAACRAAVLAVADMCARFMEVVTLASDDDADYARKKLGLAVARMADTLVQPAVDIDLGAYLNLPAGVNLDWNGDPLPPGAVALAEADTTMEPATEQD